MRHCSALCLADSLVAALASQAGSWPLWPGRLGGRRQLGAREPATTSAHNGSQRAKSKGEPTGASERLPADRAQLIGPPRVRAGPCRTVQCQAKWIRLSNGPLGAAACAAIYHPRNRIGPAAASKPPPDKTIWRQASRSLSFELNQLAGPATGAGRNRAPGPRPVQGRRAQPARLSVWPSRRLPA